MTPDQFALLAGQRQVRQPAENRFKRKLALHAGQWRAETEVRRPSEGEMAVILAAKVQPVRIGEAIRVAVRRSHDGNDALSFANPVAAHFTVHWSEARSVLA